ncbi:ficolin-1-A-like isoform X2 [Teleopsis dalmanni]|uniref:ficolin-1-A-like isoform X2 n=1 Tax=Teleopsis dalmanni TaxID=139649 RepID=UPI0018CE986C|nr:ficolin-1-A-like isoform X2 [Teleopsis dalmanni]
MSKPLGRIIKILYALIFGIYLLEIGTAYFLTTIKCINTHCPKYPTNCHDATRNTGKSGVYTLDIEGKSFLAYCEADINGGGWLVIQRRQDGSVDFNRNWTDYKSGFGNINSEFFFGLNKLHKLTNKNAHELMIVMRLFDSTVLHTKFDYFLIGSETEGYILKELGLRSGNSTFLLSWMEDFEFLTKDRYNNTLCNENFAKIINGGWWTSCTNHWYYVGEKIIVPDLFDVGNTDLNGIYNHGNDTSAKDRYLIIGDVKIKFAQMMIRPIGF